jgi:hypothetical protein
MSRRFPGRYAAHPCPPFVSFENEEGEIKNDKKGKEGKKALIALFALFALLASPLELGAESGEAGIARPRLIVIRMSLPSYESNVTRGVNCS